MAECPSCCKARNKYLEMRLAASVAFTFNSLASRACHAWLIEILCHGEKLSQPF